MAPVAAKKAAPAVAASKTSTSVKTASESAPSKGRMEGDRKGKESTGHQGRGKPTSTIESAAELPGKSNNGPARRGGRQAANNQPTRNLDRHSRMANKEGGEKRQFGGKSGWGNPADAKEAVAEAVEATAVSPAAADEDAVVIEEAPAANYMTLGQYLAEQEKKKPAVSAPKARSANDGAKVAGEVVKKDQDMYFQTAKPVVNKAATKAPAKAAAKPAAAPAAKSTKFSLQELNAVIPGGLARPPRPVREESQSSSSQRGGRQGGRRFENNASKPEAIAPAAKAANLKDDRAFPSL